LQRHRAVVFGILEGSCGGSWRINSSR